MNTVVETSDAPAMRFRTDAIPRLGKRFGSLRVTAWSHRDSRSVNHWKCLCDCGVEVTVRGANLRQGGSQSCGCRRTRKTSKDLSGQTFGRLKALARSQGKKSGYLCECICGKHTVVTAYSLLRGATKSCGCLRKEHATQRAARWRKYICPFTDQELHEMYTGREWNCLRIAVESSTRGMPTTESAVWSWLKKAGVKCRSASESGKLSWEARR